jgi:acetoin:2,6-dichlorophenolindophenol oxidoreductase subunit alpha
MYNEYTHFSETTAGDILARGPAFGVPSEAVDGQDVRAVYVVAKKLVERARAGEGPSLLLVNTYRYMGHHVGDVSREYYRSKQEEQQWKTERDPIRIMADWLVSENLADRAALDKLHDEVKAEIDHGVQFAMAAPYPTVDEVDQDVYA